MLQSKAYIFYTGIYQKTQTSTLNVPFLERSYVEKLHSNKLRHRELGNQVVAKDEAISELNERLQNLKR